MKYKLSEIFDLQMGKTPDRKNQSYWETEQNQWISIADISKSGKYITKTKEFISDKAVKDNNIKIIPQNTVILSFKLSIGKVAITSKDMYSNEAIMAFHNKDVVEVIPDYLYYLFLNHNWNKNANKSAKGITLNKTILSDVEINIDDIEKQKEIVDVLNRISNLIELREKQLQQYDVLVKSRFVEMFGNPLDTAIANRYFVECVEFNPKKSEIKDLMDEIVSFVPMECVGVDGSFTIKEDGLVKNYYKGYTYFRNGDVLLAKITPCFENGKVAIAENCTNGIGFGTTEFHVSRPIDGISNSQWIKHLLKNDFIHDFAAINMTGSAGQKRIQTPFFEKLRIYLPPIEEQNKFAAFVQQVDKSKFTVQKNIEELVFLRKSIMKQYFGE